jgi:hypothetical protein
MKPLCLLFWGGCLAALSVHAVPVIFQPVGFLRPIAPPATQSIDVLPEHQEESPSSALLDLQLMLGIGQMMRDMSKFLEELLAAALLREEQESLAREGEDLSSGNGCESESEGGENESGSESENENESGSENGDGIDADENENENKSSPLPSELLTTLLFELDNNSLFELRFDGELIPLQGDNQDEPESLASYSHLLKTKGKEGKERERSDQKDKISPTSRQTNINGGMESKVVNTVTRKPLIPGRHVVDVVEVENVERKPQHRIDAAGKHHNPPV